MRHIFALLVTLSSITAFAQDALPDSVYAVTYLTGKAWDMAKAPQDQPYFKEHSAHLSKLRKEGIIQVGMRFAEKGLIIIKSSSLSKARELINQDLAVIHQLFQVDVQKLNVFYEGCLERPIKK